MSTLQGKIILIIDDASDVRLLARRILEGDGAQVLDADCVAGGLSLIASRSPHLVITDLEMPGHTGFDFLAIRAKDPRMSAAPCIVLSGHKESETVKTAISMGVSDYLLKPFKATQLLQKVRKTLKLSSFLSKKLDGVPAQISVPAEIIRLNEAGMEIESSVKLALDADILVEAELLDEIGISKVPMKGAQKPPTYLGSGRYLSDVNFVGFDQSQTRTVRDWLRRPR